MAKGEDGHWEEQDGRNLWKEMRNRAGGTHGPKRHVDNRTRSKVRVRQRLTALPMNTMSIRGLHTFGE